MASGVALLALRIDSAQALRDLDQFKTSLRQTAKSAGTLEAALKAVGSVDLQKWATGIGKIATATAQLGTQSGSLQTVAQAFDRLSKISAKGVAGVDFMANALVRAANVLSDSKISSVAPQLKEFSSALRAFQRASAIKFDAANLVDFAVTLSAMDARLKTFSGVKYSPAIVQLGRAIASFSKTTSGKTVDANNLVAIADAIEKVDKRLSGFSGAANAALIAPLGRAIASFAKATSGVASNAKAVVDVADAIARADAALKTFSGGANLSAVAPLGRALASFAKISSGFSAVNKKAIIDIADAIKLADAALNGVSGGAYVATLGPLGRAMAAFSKATTGIVANRNEIIALASAIRFFDSQMLGFSGGAYIPALRALGAAMSSLANRKLDGVLFYRNATLIAKGIKAILNAANTPGNVGAIIAQLNAVAAALNAAAAATKAAASASKTIVRTSRSWTSTFNSFVAGNVGYRIGKTFIDVASSMQETQGKFSYVLKYLRDDGEKTVETLRKDFLFSELDAKKTVSTMVDVFNRAGLSLKESLNFSKDLTARAADLAAFTDAEGGVEHTTLALTNAMFGFGQMARRLGVTIYESAVQAKMAQNEAKGMTFATELAAKMYARYQVIMERSASAQGHMARESNNFLHKSLELQAKLSDLKNAFGLMLIDPATQAVDALKNVAAAIDALPDSAKKQIAFTFGGIGVGGGALAGISTLTYLLTPLGNVLKTVTPAFVALGKTAFPTLLKILGPATKALTGLGASLGTLGVASGVVVGVVGAITGGIASLRWAPRIVDAAFAGLSKAIEETPKLISTMFNSIVDALAAGLNGAYEAFLKILDKFHIIDFDKTEAGKRDKLDARLAPYIERNRLFDAVREENAKNQGLVEINRKNVGDTLTEIGQPTITSEASQLQSKQAELASVVERINANYKRQEEIQARLVELSQGGMASIEELTQRRNEQERLASESADIETETSGALKDSFDALTKDVDALQKSAEAASQRLDKAFASYEESTKNAARGVRQENLESALATGSVAEKQRARQLIVNDAQAAVDESIQAGNRAANINEMLESAKLKTTDEDVNKAIATFGRLQGLNSATRTSKQSAELLNAKETLEKAGYVVPDLNQTSGGDLYKSVVGQQNAAQASIPGLIEDLGKRQGIAEQLGERQGALRQARNDQIAGNREDAKKFNLDPHNPRLYSDEYMAERAKPYENALKQERATMFQASFDSAMSGAGSLDQKLGVLSAYGGADIYNSVAETANVGSRLGEQQKIVDELNQKQRDKGLTEDEQKDLEEAEKKRDELESEYLDLRMTTLNKRIEYERRYDQLAEEAYNKWSEQVMERAKIYDEVNEQDKKDSRGVSGGKAIAAGSSEAFGIMSKVYVDSQRSVEKAVDRVKEVLESFKSEYIQNFKNGNELRLEF